MTQSHQLEYGSSPGYDPYREVSPDEFAGSSTWALTLAILAGLLLIGFFAGFVTRGAAMAAVSTERAQAYEIVSSDRSEFKLLNGSVDQALTLGSQTSDEILNVRKSADRPEYILAMKLHSNSPDLPDELSVVRVPETGDITEILRFPGAGRAQLTALPATSGGVYLASKAGNQTTISELSETGSRVWSKTFLAASNDTISPQIAEHQGALIALLPTESTTQNEVSLLDSAGNTVWSLALAAEDSASLTVGESGEIFIVSHLSTEPAALLTAITPSGVKAWSSKIWLEEGESVVGSAVSGAGGLIAVLKSASSMTMMEYNVSGVLVETAALSDELSELSNVSVAASADGNALVSGLTKEEYGRRAFQVHKIKTNGDRLGYAAIDLPSNATVDVLIAADINKVLAVGSARPDRYSGTDIQLSRFSLRQDSSLPTESGPLERLVLSSVDPLAETSLDLQTIALEASEVGNELTIDPNPLTTEQIDRVANPIVPNATEAITSAPAPALLTRFVSSSWSDPARTSIISTAQCRFSCVETTESGNVFPIWRSVELRDGEPISSMSELHDLSCRSAGGIPSETRLPDCTDRF